MLRIIKKVFEKELTKDGEVILKYNIEYPQIISGTYFQIVDRINAYNKKLAVDLRSNAENELFQQAVDLYNYNKENGFPIMVFEVYRTYNVTLNNNSYFSIYFDEYTFTGGAHGNTIRSSQNWNIRTGRMINLSKFFNDNIYFLLDILRQINNQIKEDPNKYFPDANALVVETFNPKNYYLTSNNSLVIYFQQYDIAPYSSGIPTFEINI